MTTMIRIRITYAKQDPLRYTSNLDMHKIWERTLRRAQLPLAYSQGFHPQPRLNQAAPLPLGFLSSGEVIDIWLEEDLPLFDIENRLKNTLQPGLQISRLEQVDLRAPALQTQVIAAVYQITLNQATTTETLTEKTRSILQTRTLPRIRRGKQYDLRPLIEELQVLPAQEETPAHLAVRLTTRPGATGRPEELLDEMGIDSNTTRIERMQIIFGMQ